MPTLLERQLAASVAEVQQRQRDDLDDWLDAAPVPPKRLKRTRKMTEAIVIHRDVAPVLEFTPVQQQMIRDTYANGADAREFEVLMEVAKLRRLNPMLKQIHFVKRWNKDLGRHTWSAQVSVDGLRAIAERTGKYDGQDEPEFGPMEGGFPSFARLKVYRKDWSRPAVGTAYWSEYVQRSKDGGPTRFWKEMPRVMLAKCAEAIAMRKAFPEDMGGLYVDEEMQQADNTAQLTHVSPHSNDGTLADEMDSAEFERVMAELEKCKREVFDPGCTWETMNRWRAVLGTKANPAEFSKDMSALYKADKTSEQQRKALGSLWNSCDRKLTALEGKLKPPPVEASFTDEPDGTEPLGAAERIPGEDDD